MGKGAVIRSVHVTQWYWMAKERDQGCLRDSPWTWLSSGRPCPRALRLWGPGFLVEGGEFSSWLPLQPETQAQGGEGSCSGPSVLSIGVQRQGMWSLETAGTGPRNCDGSRGHQGRPRALQGRLTRDMKAATRPSPACTEDGRSLEADGMSHGSWGVREKALRLLRAACLTPGPRPRCRGGGAGCWQHIKRYPGARLGERSAVSPGGISPLGDRGLPAV